MTTIFALIVVLGVLIFFHEFGHFLLARFFGVGVERFSLGFGPRLFGFKRGRTDYRVSAVPLGGYVKMVGEDPDEEIPEDDIPESFTHQPAINRILIVVAGPVFNFLLPVIIFYGLFQIQGVRTLEPVIGQPEPGSPAQAAGLRAGDRITAIDEIPVNSFEQLREVIEAGNGRPLSLFVSRDGDALTFSLRPEMATRPNDFGEDIEAYSIGVFPLLLTVVGGLQPGGPAAAAGLKIGDRIVAIDGRPIQSWGQMTDIIENSQGRPLEMMVARDGGKVTFTVTPVRREMKTGDGDEAERYIIGISNAWDFAVQYERFGPIETMRRSLAETWRFVRLTIIGIGKMFSGSLSVKENLGGPIMIAQLAGESAKQGTYSFFSFMAIISITLAILNLLPIPVLDGGHLMFYTIEIIRRRPVDLKTREIAQQVGMIFLICLMALVFYNDIARLIN